MYNNNCRNFENKFGLNNPVNGFRHDSSHQYAMFSTQISQTNLLQSQTSTDSTENQYSPVNFEHINGVPPEPPQDYQDDRDCTKGKRGCRILTLLAVLAIVISAAIITLSLLVSLNGSSVHSTRIVNITNTVYRDYHERM